MRRNACVCLTVLLATACSDRILDDEPAIDPNAPRVYITTPTRGAMLPDNQVAVEGLVEDADSEVTGVEINGVSVPLSADGRFRTLLPVDDGITQIRTVATDVDGNEGKDTRSVMAGHLVTPKTPVLDGAAGRIGRTTFEKINKTVVNLLESPDEIVKLIDAVNPLVDEGDTCLAATLELTELIVKKADVEVFPIGPGVSPGTEHGGISFDIQLTDVTVNMKTNFAVACLKGSADILATADSAYISGDFRIGIENGQLDIDLSIASGFNYLDIDIGVVKSEIIEFFLWDLEGTAADAVEGIIEEQMRSFVDGFLTKFVNNEWQLNVGDAQLLFGATPTIVDFNDDGGFIAVDTSVQALNPRDNVGYVMTPTLGPFEETRTFEGFRALLSDDYLNQALAAFWSTGALENAVAFDSNVEQKESFLGSTIDRVEVTVLLPPYIDAWDGRALSISVGDMLIDVINEAPLGDEVVTRLALSAQMAISVDVDEENRMTFRTETPQLWVDILEDGVSGANQFNRDEIELLASFVAKRAADATDDLIGQIPIPSLAGTSVRELELAPDRGYVVVGGNLEIPE